MTWRQVLLAYLIGVTIIAGSAASVLLASARGRGAGTYWPHGKCFPRALWDARDRYRPCARIVRVDEDGSIVAQVQDHDGTVRFGFRVGARDR